VLEARFDGAAGIYEPIGANRNGNHGCYYDFSETMEFRTLLACPFREAGAIPLLDVPHNEGVIPLKS
jgi:hypothetical protein